MGRAGINKLQAGLRWWWHSRTWKWRLVTLGIFLSVMTPLLLTIYFIRDLPSVNRLKSNDNFAVSTQILDRDGVLLYEIFADTNRTPIPLDDLPPYVAEATIAIEDKNFYRHFGIDVIGITRAIINNIRGESLQGGSTITQQLVKVSLLSRERTIERKLKEAFLTLLTELRYSKRDILGMYLNYVPYGGTAWGIEAAAQTFFDKPATELTLAEAAFLAGLPQSPTRYSPFGSTPELGQKRQQEVLRRMREDGYITAAQEEEAVQQKLEFASYRVDIKAPHFVFYVRDKLVEQYGQAMVEKGGLRVTTTLDYDLQETVQASVAAEIANLERHRVGNGAALVTRPKTGEILAMAGSRDYFNATAEGQINMTIRPRQPGSSMKPLNLATAFQLRNATPGTVLLDIPTCFESIGSDNYCPRNYDGSYHGPVDMRHALANSYNIPAVKVTALNGVESIINVAGNMGISTFRDPENYGLSLGLGSAEVTMVDMATAFGTMANQGVKVPLISILKVEDYQGEVLLERNLNSRREEIEKQLFLAPTDDATTRPQPDPRPGNDPDNITRVLDKEVAWLMNDILRDNQARSAAFGSRSQLYIPGHTVAAKTGTTNDLRDNWTIGYTPSYLTVVWVGNNDNSPMNPYLVSGITGAAPIWNDVMSYLLDQYAVNNPNNIQLDGNNDDGSESNSNEISESNSSDTDTDTDKNKNENGNNPTSSLEPWPAKPKQVVEASFCARSGALPNPEGPECTMRTDFFWKGTEPQQVENVWHGTWIAEQTGLPAKEGDPTDKLKFEEHILLSDPFTRDYCLDCTRKTIETTDENGDTVQKPQPEVYFVSAEKLWEIQQGAWKLAENEPEEGLKQNE